MSKLIAVLGSSRPEPKTPAYLLAEELGSKLAKSGYIVVNGGYDGIMEASAKGAVEAGGKAVGVTVELFPEVPANQYITEEKRTATLQERLQLLLEGTDAAIFLKGGTGTLLELAACWEYINKQIIQPRPMIFMGWYWLPLLELLKDEVDFDDPRAKNHLDITTKDFIKHAANPDEALEILDKFLG